MNSYRPLKITMKSKGITSDKLARLIGVSGPTVRRYMNNSVNPTLEVLDRITDALDCGIEDVVCNIHAVTRDQLVEDFREEVNERFSDSPADKETFVRLMVSAFERGLDS